MHRVVSQALEGGVQNRNWFIWVDVSGESPPPDLSPLITRTEQWLHDLDAGTSQSTELNWSKSGLTVLLRALAKKPHARGANPLVGNPYPAFAYWATS